MDMGVNRQSGGNGFFMRLLRDAGLAVSLLRDYRKGVYRVVPRSTLLAILLAFFYLFFPADLIPDVLPVVGLVDDALILFACLALVEKDLSAYGEWKNYADRSV